MLLDSFDYKERLMDNKFSCAYYATRPLALSPILSLYEIGVGIQKSIPIGGNLDLCQRYVETCLKQKYSKEDVSLSEAAKCVPKCMIKSKSLKFDFCLVV